MKKILIVDDDPMVRQLVHLTLGASYELFDAPDGETALDLLEADRPDAILLDWVLPGLSGLTVFRRLRRYPECEQVPVIMISARGEEQTRAAAEEAGMAGCLAKPFDVNELREVVARALET